VYLAENSSNDSSWCSERRRAEVLKLPWAEGRATRVGRTMAARADSWDGAAWIVLARKKVVAGRAPRAAARKTEADIGGRFGRAEQRRLAPETGGRRPGRSCGREKRATLGEQLGNEWFDGICYRLGAGNSRSLAASGASQRQVTAGPSANQMLCFTVPTNSPRATQGRFPWASVRWKRHPARSQTFRLRLSNMIIARWSQLTS